MLNWLWSSPPLAISNGMLNRLRQKLDIVPVSAVFLSFFLSTALDFPFSLRRGPDLLFGSISRDARLYRARDSSRSRVRVTFPYSLLPGLLPHLLSKLRSPASVFVLRRHIYLWSALSSTGFPSLSALQLLSADAHSSDDAVCPLKIRQVL